MGAMVATEYSARPVGSDRSQKLVAGVSQLPVLSKTRLYVRRTLALVSWLPGCQLTWNYDHSVRSDPKPVGRIGQVLTANYPFSVIKQGTGLCINT